MDLNFWDGLGRKNTLSYIQRNTVISKFEIHLIRRIQIFWDPFGREKKNSLTIKDILLVSLSADYVPHKNSTSASMTDLYNQMALLLEVLLNQKHSNIFSSSELQ